MSAEATTSLGGNAYQITNTARQCVNPDAAWHLLDSGTTTIAYTSITTVAFEFGIFSLAAAPSGAVTVGTGAYLPLTTSSEDVAEGVQFSASHSRDLYDITVFGQSVRSRLAGLKDVEISLQVISSPSAYSALYAAYASGGLVCVEIDPDGASGSGAVLRAFTTLESVERSASVDGRVESTLMFKMNARKDSVLGLFNAGYSWR